MPQRPHFLYDLIDKGLVDRLLYIDPFNGRAYLTGIHQGPQTHALLARSKSASFKTIKGSLPPSSRDTGIKPVGGPAHDLLPDLYAAGKGNHVDVVDQRLTGLCGTYDDLSVDLLGIRLLGKLDNEQSGERSQLRWLNDDRIPRHECRHRVTSGEYEWKIPRANDADDAQWMVF